MQLHLVQCPRAPASCFTHARTTPRRPLACAGTCDRDASSIDGAQRRAVLLGGLSAVIGSSAKAELATSANTPREGEVRRSDAEWKAMLPADAYRVLRQASTERPRSSPLLKETRAGTFLCAGCSAPLFSSAAKYDSGTGWPSFKAALPDATTELPDFSLHWEPRIEVRCKKCQGHLGHVFPDGPPPANQRYCMNGVALKFAPSEA